MKVLLVDDGPVMLMILEKLLKSIGPYKIDTAENGIDAFETYNQNRHDIIVTDNLMPVMSGVEFLCKAKNIIEQHDTKIILVSIEPNKNIFDQLKDNGIKIDDFLSKPINIDRFTKKIKELTVERLKLKKKSI